ncbi:MAG: SMP-30/gluconolactonase/LRE family protein [Rhodococcus sp. (in: high G+C Gram-positive bacteria)]|uniref:SMP-30/gluconolactonase/LRE family protein n=1 Tax=Rhodococcus sp. TaxID=1831 RepID=UPI003BB8108D
MHSPKPPLDPTVRRLPPPPPRAAGRTGPEPFPAHRIIPLTGHAPEDVVVDSDGRLVCGVADGRILRVDPATDTERTLAATGGRPLGLEMCPDGSILVCDAYRGLLRLDPATGTVTTIADVVDGEPLRFCSNATLARDGTIWFTQSSTRHDLDRYVGALLEHRGSGRLLRRDPDGAVHVVLDGLHFPNGITLTEDETAVLFVETDGYRLTRVPVDAPHAPDVLLDNLPGMPDNVSRARGGRLWIAMVTPRNRLLDRLGATPPWLRRLLWRLPTPLLTRAGHTTWVMCVGEDGRVLRDLQADDVDFPMVTGVVEHDARLYLGSLDRPGILVVDLPR